jgi:hypothetical protein
MKQSATIAIKGAPHSVLLEGPERFCDHVQSAGCNTIIIYTHWGSIGWRGDDALAPDHGIDYGNARTWNHPELWVRTDESFYGDTPFRMRRFTGTDFAGRDVLDELLPEAKKRGLRVYSRILEHGVGAHDPEETVRAVDLDGETLGIACWNNPNWRAWYRAMGADLFANYDLDGMHWGCERQGPLSSVLLWRCTPACFCEHCCQRNAALGVGGARAREGYAKILELTQALANGGNRGGALVAVLQLLFEYPEVLSWEYQWQLAREETFAGLREAIHSQRADADVGWHIWQYTCFFDLFQRAILDYRRLAGFSDHIKPVAYHDVAGPRLGGMVRDFYCKSILADLPPDEALSFFYRATGFDPKSMPGFDAEGNIDDSLGIDYLRAENLRALKGCEGTDCRVLASIDIDIPDPRTGTINSDPEDLEACIRSLAEDGVHGFILAREYDEMRLPNLLAVGQALQDCAY